MHIFGTYWKTWYPMVSEQTCTIDHKMDKSLWQTIISTLQIGTVSRLRLCRRSWWFKIYTRWNSVHFWKSYVCVQSVGCVRNKLEFRTVQQNQKSFPWTQDWGWTVYPNLIYGIWSSQFFTETRIRVIKNGETRLWTNVKFVQYLTHFKNERNLMEWLTIWTVLILFPSSVNSSHQEALLYVFEDNEAVIKTNIKGRRPTMRHVSRTHRVALDWLFDRINLDPKTQIK